MTENYHSRFSTQAIHNQENAFVLRAKRVNVVTLPPSPPTDIYTTPTSPIVDTNFVKDDTICSFVVVDDDIVDYHRWRLINTNFPNNVRLEDNTLLVKQPFSASLDGETLRVEIEVLDDYSLCYVETFEFPIINVPPFTNTTSTSFNETIQDEEIGDADATGIMDREFNEAWAVSFWVKRRTSPAGTKALISRYTDAAKEQGWSIGITAGDQINIRFRPNSYNRSQTYATSLTVGVWSHVVVNYSGSGDFSGCRVWIDGVLDSNVGSGILDNFNTAGQIFAIAAKRGTNHFDGWMDEISYWGKELTADEIQEIYNSGDSGVDLSKSTMAANLVHWYRMGDIDTAPTITDVFGGQDLTMTNMDQSNFVLDVAV
jgi:hypothetical protein